MFYLKGIYIVLNCIFFYRSTIKLQLSTLILSFLSLFLKHLHLKYYQNFLLIFMLKSLLKEKTII